MSDKLKQALMLEVVTNLVNDPVRGFQPNVLPTVLKFVQAAYTINSDAEWMHKDMYGSYSLEEFFDYDLENEQYLFTAEHHEQRRRELILASDPSQKQMNAMSDRSLWSSVPEQQERHNG